MRFRNVLAAVALAAIGVLTIPSITGIETDGAALAKGSGDRGSHAEAPPVADAGRDAVAAVGDVVVLDGSGSTDPEVEELGYAWRLLERPATSQAALSDPAAPKPSFTVDADGRYLFELVVVSDEEVYSAPDIVEINTGDVAPAADAGPDAQVLAGTTATLDGAGSGDAGGDLLHYKWRLVSQPAGSAASLSDTAAVRPTIAVDMAGDYVAELEVGDGVASGADRVILSTGQVAPAAAAGADQPATPYVPLVLDAELTGDADGDILKFDWALLSAPDEAEAEIARRHARRAAFVFSDPGTYVLQLTVSDAGGDVARDTVVVSTGNTPPVADAGPDQAIAPGTRLRLDASRSTDLDGDRLLVRWALIAAPDGSAAALEDTSAVRPWFAPDLDGTYVLQLAVFDGTEWSAPDSVVLTTGNLPPVADAGPDRWQKERGAVTLDGLASSDANGDALTYRWALLDGPRGSRAVIADAAAAETQFTADRRGTYLAQLVVDDGTAESAPSLVVIGVGKGAWGDEKDSGYDDFDDFDGFERDDDEDDEEDDEDDDGGNKRNKRAALDGYRIVPAGYTLPKGSNGKGHEEHGEGNGTGHEEHGNGHGYGHYEDDDDDDDDDHGGKQAGFSGHPGDVNIRPVADPGVAQRLPTGAFVQLDGSGSSDANGDALTYRWDLIVAPEDSTAEIDDPASPAPSFTADVSGFYVAQLVVFDGLMFSFPRTVAILANTAPVADAGPDLEVDAGTTALLDGTGSFDPDGDALTYSWTVIAYPAGGTTHIDDATSATASFTPNVDGIYEVQLVVNDGIENSAPDTAILTVFSNPPVAEAGDDQVVVAGTPATLDGTGSYDPDGQDITYSWRFTARPKDSIAALDDATLAQPTFTPDKEGLYILELVVSDGRLESRPDVVGVRAWSGIVNNAPVLDAVGDQMVVLGASLSLTLTASDPDGDAVYFNATPLPLPDGASLDAVTGAFTYRPTADQVGSFTLTFTASDGIASDSESVLITVITPPPGTLTALAGRVLDADTGDDATPLAVRGATVALVGTGISATTDDEGNFLLSGVPAGNRVLAVSGATAQRSPDNKAYGGIRADVSVIAETTNEAGDFYLPRVDTDGRAFYVWYRSLTINNTRMGVSLTIPTFAIAPNGTPRFSGYFSVSDMPAAQATPLLPSRISACQVVAIEPFGATINAWISLPNRDGLVPGSEVDIWNLHPGTGEFRITGTGRVSADGARIDTIRGRVTWATLVFAAPVAPRAVASVDMNGHNYAPTLLADGNVSQPIALPGVMSLGQDRSQTLLYNSALADPRPIVATDTTIFARTGVPPTIEALLEVGGVAVAGPAIVDTNNPAPLPENTDATIRHALQFDAGALETGIHPYRFTATANYGCSTVSNSFGGEIIVNNESDSPFGAGWTLAGLERLHFEEDGDILLTGGDGSAKAYDSKPAGKFFPPIGIPAADPGAGALDDFNGDGHLDMAVPAMDTGVLIVLLGDGTGEFPIDRRFAAGRTRWSSGPPDVHSVASGDFNNDGVRDLVVNNQLLNRVRIYLGRGDGSFQLVEPQIALGRPQGVGVADFDGDGNDDFVVATSAGFFSTSHRTFVYFGDGTGRFPRSQQFNRVEQPTNVAIADFDNNGAPDFAVASGRNRIYMMLNDGAGNFIQSQTPVAPILWVIGRYPLAAADFNGDGIQDLAATVDDGVHFAIYLGNGTGGFSSQQLIPTGIGEVNSVTATDYDQDGDMDVVASGRFTGTIVLFESDGAGNVVVEETVPIQASVLHSVRAGDFNNDGAPDLQTGGGQNIYVLIADRSGNNRFRSPGADFSTLVKNDDGTYVRRMTDGTTIEYNEDGLMTARVDANGNRTEYSYNTDGLLTGISDPADPSRSTVFDYQGGSLSGITDLAGRTSFFQVGADGKLTSFQDAESNIFRYAYDGESKLTAFASARGFVTSFDYGFAGEYLSTSSPDGTSVTADVTKSLGLIDPGLETGEWIAPEDRIAKMQDAKGNIYEFEINEYGHPVRITDPIGRTKLVERDADNLVRRTVAPSDIDPSGTLVTELEYDANGNVISETEGAGTAFARTTRFEYEPVFNRTTKVIDPAGGETVLEYDPANGNLLKVTDAEGGMQSFAYDPRGLRLTATDQNGNITRFTYNFFGNLETSTNGEGEVTKMLRDAAGNMIGVTEGFGTAEARTTDFEFDALGRIVLETDATGAVTESVYDADGNVITEIDATGIAKISEYDVMNRLAAETHPATGTMTRTYDENGNMASMIDPLGNVAHFQYDAVNRNVRTEDPAGGVRVFAYDSQDNPVQVIDANGNATYFKFDALGREIERSNQLNNVWTFAYDSRDNMVDTIDAKGQRIEKVYDALSRMTRMVLYRADGSEADDQNFAYDAMSLKTLAYDNDSSLAWSYDAANRVATAAVHGGLTNVQPATVLTHSYDAAGNRTNLADSVGGVTGFRHDGEGRLTRVTTAAGDTIDFAYDLAGRLVRIAYPTAAGMLVTYDSLTGRPGRITQTSGAAELLQLAYGYGTDGKITSIADVGGTREFTYDATLQLTGGGYTDAPESYAYDAEGNRTSSHRSGGYTHDAANRLIEDADACYTYDANGNLETKTEKIGVACTGGVTTYSWDVLNRLVGIDFADGTYAAYRYDAHGRRIEKDVNGAITRYVYDDDALLLEFDGTNTLQARYTHGEEIDQPLAMARSGQSYFYHTDHLGSVRLLTDAAGAVANRYDYDAFGNLEATAYETVANPFGFTARERDAESGLMFYRARYYDPKIGRFISQDPIGFKAEDLNLYRYVFNNALNMIDPDGQALTFRQYAFISMQVLSILTNAFLDNYIFNVGSQECKFAQAAIIGLAALAAGLAFPSLFGGAIISLYSIALTAIIGTVCWMEETYRSRQ